MTLNLLSAFPSIEGLTSKMKGISAPVFREANGHIHTPYSFSAFESLKTIFSMARDEEIAVLGINDFYVTDGYDVFYSECLRNNIFPLFNIEFTGLMKNEQQSGIRINDPNNPGRIYFCGKGLDYPFSAGWMDKLQLDRVRKESQKQVRMMVDRLSDLITEVNPSILKDFVEFLNEKGFVITFGTEHNTPELIPLTVSARGGVQLDETLKKIAWEGACVIAAHQYLRSQRRQGFMLDDGTVSIKQKESLSILGRIVIEYYLNRKVYEPGD